MRHAAEVSAGAWHARVGACVCGVKRQKRVEECVFSNCSSHIKDKHARACATEREMTI